MYVDVLKASELIRIDNKRNFQLISNKVYMVILVHSSNDSLDTMIDLRH